MQQQPIATAVACTTCGWRWMAVSADAAVVCPECRTTNPFCLAADAVQDPGIVSPPPVHPRKDDDE